MRLRTLVSAAVLLLANAVARADSFSFSFSGTGVSGAGHFTTVATVMPGEYLITAATGTIAGSSFTLLPPGAYTPPGSDPNDNLLFYPGTPGTFFDFDGVSFLLNNGILANLYSDSVDADLYVAFPTGGDFNFTLDDLKITPDVATTPELPSLALLCTGLCGVVGLVKTRRS